MTPERFFELFLKELEERPDMYHYYKFLEDSDKLDFRKNYFLERLRYIGKSITDPNKSVWDCGCGYGTTCLFLAMNGIKTKGITLEFYTENIEQRFDYWNQFGEANLFSYSHKNLFDYADSQQQYNQIIIQDTLHHLEPIHDALKILYNSLKPEGHLVIIEENGNNIIQRAKLYKQRGNNRIITVKDEKTGKDVLMGNENIRSLTDWAALLDDNGFEIPEASIQYIRYFLPHRYHQGNGQKLLEKEREMQKKQSLKREYLFFGLNFIANKR